MAKTKVSKKEAEPKAKVSKSKSAKREKEGPANQPVKAAESIQQKQEKIEQPADKMRKRLVSLLTASLKEKKAVLGAKETAKLIRRGELKEIICSENTPAELMKDLSHYAQLSNVTITHFSGDSRALGEMCGKPFNVLVVGIQK